MTLNRVRREPSAELPILLRLVLFFIAAVIVFGVCLGVRDLAGAQPAIGGSAAGSSDRARDLNVSADRLGYPEDRSEERCAGSEDKAGDSLLGPGSKCTKSTIGYKNGASKDFGLAAPRESLALKSASASPDREPLLAERNPGEDPLPQALLGRPPPA